MPSLRKHHRQHGRVISPHELQLILERNVKALPFSVTEGAVDKFVEFILLLDKWNGVYNLTSVRDKSQMVNRHILDSLVVHPFLSGERILDVGVFERVVLDLPAGKPVPVRFLRGSTPVFRALRVPD